MWSPGIAGGSTPGRTSSRRARAAITRGGAGRCRNRTGRWPASPSARRPRRAICSPATSAPASASGSSSSVSRTPRPLRSRSGIRHAFDIPPVKLLFTKRGFSPVGGSESLAYQFAVRLAARGHDVRVVCAWPAEKEETAYRRAAFDPIVHDDHRVFVDQGVQVVQVKPRGGILGKAADATTLVDLMRGELLERYAEDRDLIPNAGRAYSYPCVPFRQELELPLPHTPIP